MQVDTILNNAENSFLMITSGEVKDVIIGIPHHTPLGTTEMPCKEHPDSDENVGFLGIHVANLLNCSSIIACNYFIDSNKSEESDYFKMVHLWKPKILIEIHGHGSRIAKANFNIEISSGSIKRNFWSLEIAERLRNKLSDVPLLQRYTLSGDFNLIYYKAKKSVSITTSEWLAFHIEVPLSMRASKGEYSLFDELLAETTKDMLRDFDKLSEAYVKHHA